MAGVFNGCYPFGGMASVEALPYCHIYQGQKVARRSMKKAAFALFAMFEPSVVAQFEISLLKKCFL